MILNKIDDPRSALQKATRYEVYKFAKANGVSEITSESMPKPLMINILRGKGITNIKIPRRDLGSIHFPGGGTGGGPAMPAAPATTEAAGVEIDADADIARQWAEQQARAAAALASAVQTNAAEASARLSKPIANMSINELGSEMKRLGIKRDRRDNMITMRAKIEAKLANG